MKYVDFVNLSTFTHRALYPSPTLNKQTTNPLKCTLIFSQER